MRLGRRPDRALRARIAAVAQLSVRKAAAAVGCSVTTIQRCRHNPRPSDDPLGARSDSRAELIQHGHRHECSGNLALARDGSAYFLGGGVLLVANATLTSYKVLKSLSKTFAVM